jgi:hypothetical protein
MVEAGEMVRPGTEADLDPAGRGRLRDGELTGKQERVAAARR